MATYTYISDEEYPVYFFYAREPDPLDHDQISLPEALVEGLRAARHVESLMMTAIIDHLAATGQKPLEP